MSHYREKLNGDIPKDAGNQAEGIIFQTFKYVRDEL